MNKKAQSALEYLMTYGWALIVIAIVIGILWYVTSSATGGVTCQSRSNNFAIKGQAVSATDGVRLTLQNGTGQIVTFKQAAGSGAFGGTYPATPFNLLVPANGSFDINALITVTVPAGTAFDNGTVNVSVLIGTLPASVDIVCSGKV